MLRIVNVVSFVIRHDSNCAALHASHTLMHGNISFILFQGMPIACVLVLAVRADARFTEQSHHGSNVL